MRPDFRFEEYKSRAKTKSRNLRIWSSAMTCWNTSSLEYLENVLNHIDFLATKAVFLKIHCGEAKKFLPDVRNAHLTQEHYSWWLPKLWKRWEMQHFASQKLGFGFVGVSE